MALNKNTTPSNKFENVDEDGNAVENTASASTPSPAERLKAEAESRAAAVAASAAAVAASAAASSAAASTSTQVVTQKPNAGQVAAARPMIDPIATLKDVFPVEYDTLCNVQLNQGNAINKDTNQPLGDVVGLELLSFQDQTVVSPGVDGNEAKEFVRYSNDGITTTKGESVVEYLAQLKSGAYPKANISQRVIIVGSLFDPGTKGAKIAGMKDKLVQINLPPSSVASFKRYKADQAFKIGKNLAQVAGVERIRITCNIKTNGDNTYTVADFTRYDDEAA